MPAKILLVDDNELARTAMKLLLADRPEWEICGEAIDGEDAVQQAKTNCPDLAIIDIEMPRKNGIQAAREILGFCPQTIIVSNSVHDERVLLDKLREAGVRAFIPKDRLASDLIPAIQTVLSGGTLLGMRHAPAD